MYLTTLTLSIPRILNNIRILKSTKQMRLSTAIICTFHTSKRCKNNLFLQVLTYRCQLPDGS